MSNDKRNLHYLHELSKYEVANDDPDVRGWDLVDGDGRHIGKVDNFLVSKDAMRVRYLDVEIDKKIIDKEHKPLKTGKTGGTHEYINQEGDNHLIVPIGMVRLDNEHKEVYTDKIDSNTFDTTERVEKNKAIDPAYEVYVVEHFTGSETGYRNKVTDAAFYDRDVFRHQQYQGR
ncbi:PRC-barrel domain-containing protein [Roseivirga sp. BDSF3-8]|uniref:PRC-barrel domain-containing protein n=1 Tax=Roseivirga sp. BDSF3-8 TaxID=3241598 RepID=UPI0035318F12